MNAHLHNILPAGLVGQIIYCVADEWDEEEAATVSVVSDGMVIGMTASDSGDIHLLVESGEDRKLEMWEATACQLEKPEGWE